MDWICAEAGSGRYHVTAAAALCGGDLQILLYGGTRPHIGAAALAGPAGGVQTLALPSHRDDSVAAEAAGRFARAFACNVSVSAGIHIDSASPGEIRLLVENCRACCALLERKLSPHFRPAEPRHADRPE